MSLPDHSPGAISAWQPGASSPIVPIAPSPWDEPVDDAPPPRKLTFRVVCRAACRHWWQILLIWGAGSAGLMALAHAKIKPSYMVTAFVQIDPPVSSIFVNGSSNISVESQMLTQAQLITSPDVLGPAIMNPDAAKLPRIQMALDPEADLRKELSVQIVKGTPILTISLSSSTSSQEAVTIVNAVVDSYKEFAKGRSTQDINGQTEYLKETKAQFEGEVLQKKNALKELSKNAEDLPDKDGKTPKTALEQLESSKSLTLIELQSYSREMTQIGYELIDARMRLASLEARRPGPESARKLDRMVEDRVSMDPDVLQAWNELSRAERRKTAAGTVARNAGDAARQSAANTVKQLQASYDRLVERKKPRIRQALELELNKDGDKEFAEAKTKVASLQKRKEMITEKLKNLNSASKAAERDNFMVAIAQDELRRAQDLLAKIELHRLELEQQAKQGQARIKSSAAKPSKQATSDNRTRLMAAAPVGTMALVLGLFVMLEVRAGRVNDPNELRSRLRLGVIGVVPPLPGRRQTLSLPWSDGEARARRHVDEYIQSLDHLRVAISAGRTPGAGHRCVLITSACGGEGKTTLAAQLAGRCANAGLLTLLIDADLRRPALGTLLDVPDGPGLSDVLVGEIEPEAAMVVIGNAGGFHLLPSGSPGHDPSRLLQGNRLGPLLARFRETFDIVIIDAPPVLAVPDALQLGRWTDGAIVAVRHDSSRFSLVERANQRLASIGVPVLGAVVNGCKSNDAAAYGSYASSYPSRGASESAE